MDTTAKIFISGQKCRHLHLDICGRFLTTLFKYDLKNKQKLSTVFAYDVLLHKPGERELLSNRNRLKASTTVCCLTLLCRYSRGTAVVVAAGCVVGPVYLVVVPVDRVVVVPVVVGPVYLVAVPVNGVVVVAVVVGPVYLVVVPVDGVVVVAMVVGPVYSVALLVNGAIMTETVVFPVN